MDYIWYLSKEENRVCLWNEDRVLINLEMYCLHETIRVLCLFYIEHRPFGGYNQEVCDFFITISSHTLE